jgi:hypothetical protein
LPAASVPLPPGPCPLENAIPSPTVRGIGSERCVDDASSCLHTDIRENRMDPLKTFACAGKCGNSEW